MPVQIIFGLHRYFERPQPCPEQRVSPPDPDPEIEDRNLRNSCRRDIVKAVNTVIDRMEELEWENPAYLETLRAIRNEAQAGMED